MYYLPLSSDYKESVRKYYSFIGCDYLVFACRNILAALNSDDDNRLLTWAKSNDLNMLHLLRFLRHTNSDWVYLSDFGIDFEWSDSMDHLETSTGLEPLKTEDGFIYFFLGDKKIVLNTKERSKERDDFIDDCPEIGFGFNLNHENKVVIKNKIFLTNQLIFNNYDHLKSGDSCAVNTIKRVIVSMFSKNNSYDQCFIGNINDLVTMFLLNIDETKKQFDEFLKQNKKFL